MMKTPLAATCWKIRSPSLMTSVVRAFSMVRAKCATVLAVAFALVAAAACERLAEPEPEASGPPDAGADEQANGETLGEDPHMVELAREIPGFGGYWYEHESAPAPGVAGADQRPDGGRLVIALTEASAGSFPAARRAVVAKLATEATRAPSLDGELPDPPPEVVERVVEYSFIELARHRARLRALFSIPEVVSLAVDEEINRVAIGLEDPSVRAAVWALVTDLGVPVEVLSFSQESGVKMLSRSSGGSSPHLSLSGLSGTLQGPVPDGRLLGGYQVQAEGGKICTLGFTAVLDNGGEVFVSNSHCSNTPFGMDFGDWGQPTTSNVVGVEVEDPPVRRCWKWCGWRPCRVDCRDSDASMMAVNTDVPISLGRIGKTYTWQRDCTLNRRDRSTPHCSIDVDPLNPTLRIARTRSSSDKGNVLDKMGSTTGWTWGWVTATCKDVRSATNRVVIECADEVDFRLSWGDSGAPVFRYSSVNRVELRGILFGMREEIKGSGGVHRKGYFQDLEQIQRDLGSFRVMPR